MAILKWFPSWGEFWVGWVTVIRGDSAAAWTLAYLGESLKSLCLHRIWQTSQELLLNTQANKKMWPWVSSYTSKQGKPARGLWMVRRCKIPALDGSAEFSVSKPRDSCTAFSSSQNLFPDRFPLTLCQLINILSVATALGRTVGVEEILLAD